MTDSDDGIDEWSAANAADQSPDDAGSETPLEAVARADAATAESAASDAEVGAGEGGDRTVTEAAMVGETETGQVHRLLDAEAGVVVYTYESDQRSNITTIPLADTLLEDE